MVPQDGVAPSSRASRARILSVGRLGGEIGAPCRSLTGLTALQGRHVDTTLTERKSPREDLHLHQALIQCDPGYKAGYATLHHAAKNGRRPRTRTAHACVSGRCLHSLTRRRFLEIEPARRVAPPGRRCFLSLADRPRLAICLTCNEHGSGDGEPRDPEGSGCHSCPLSGWRPRSEEFGRLSQPRSAAVKSKWSPRWDSHPHVHEGHQFLRLARILAPPRGERNWSEREDLHLHGLAPTSFSDSCVY